MCERTVLTVLKSFLSNVYQRREGCRRAEDGKILIFTSSGRRQPSWLYGPEKRSLLFVANKLRNISAYLIVLPRHVTDALRLSSKKTKTTAPLKRDQSAIHSNCPGSRSMSSAQHVV